MRVGSHGRHYRQIIVTSFLYGSLQSPIWLTKSESASSRERTTSDYNYNCIHCADLCALIITNFCLLRTLVVLLLYWVEGPISL